MADRTGSELSSAVVSFVSSEGVAVSCSVSGAKLCGIYQSPERVGDVMHCPGVSTVCLEHIVEFLEHQAENGAITLSCPLLGKGELQDSGLSDWCCAWIARVPILQVFDVLEAADAMEAHGPAEVAAARLASYVSSMSVRMRMQLFGRPDGLDMTESEETRLREANAWAVE